MTTSAYPGASAVLERLFMPYTLRLPRDGTDFTCICGLSTTTVALQEDVNGRRQVTLAHILKVPTATSFTLRPGERFTLDDFPGERYRVIGPYHSNLRLNKRYTVTEVR